MDQPLKIVQFGLGPIGLEAARLVIEKSPQLKLVGAIDIASDKQGIDVGELLGLDQPTGVIIFDDAESIIKEAQPDIILHCTGSFLDQIEDQLAFCIQYAHVISSAEELSYPWQHNPEIAGRLDKIAVDAGHVLLGTGVNPGYVMDLLPLVATAPCRTVDHILIERIVDAGLRRLPLQNKVGAGITAAQFEQKKATGKFGHIGLRESLYHVAAGLGWKLDHDEEVLDSMIAPKDFTTQFLAVKSGEVAGINHSIKGFIDGKIVLELTLKMYVGAEKPRDQIQVTGDPNMNLEIHGGTFGDTATISMMVNAIGSVLKAPAGLKTMHELAPVRPKL